MTASQTIAPPPSVENTALVVVTYYPDEQARAAVLAATSQFSSVFVVDNTPDPEVVKQFLQSSQIELLSNGENAGLGRALNQGCEAALSAQFEWVVTLDQDSQLEEGFLLSQLTCWQEARIKPFLLGSNFLSKSGATAPARFTAGHYSRECRTVITAGTLMHLRQWHQLGRFREDFFIDSLDHELCLRARSQGFRVARNGEIYMIHSIGSGKQARSWLPFEHSPLRKYTSTRNTVRTILDYGFREPVWALKRVAGILYEAASVVLLEYHKVKKLKAMGQGVADGLRNRLGPPTINFDHG